MAVVKGVGQHIRMFDRVNPFFPFLGSYKLTWEELDKMDKEEADKLFCRLIWKEMIPSVMILLLAALILFVNLNRIIAWIVGILVSKGVIW